MKCQLCDESVYDDWVPIGTPEGPGRAHRSCMLREVSGGIGHLIAHEYWCGPPRNDPDAGLTRRQSAKLVDAYFKAVGVEKAVKP